MTRNETLLQRLAYVVGNGMIFWFFSEYFFVNEGPAFTLIDNLATPDKLAWVLLEMLFWYGLVTSLFLLAVSYYRVHTISAIFLAGCIYGWAVEGLFIPVLYENIPASFIWPSAGHVLVDVLLGWYLIRVLLRKNNTLLTIVMAVLLGLAWGAWATWFWIGEGERRITPDEFTVFALFTSVIWISGTGLADRAGRLAFRPTRAEIVILLTLCALLFAYMTFAVGFLSVLILPLAGLVQYALYRNRKMEQRENIIRKLGAVQPGWSQYGYLLFTPVTAILTYDLIFDVQAVSPVKDLVVPALFLAGGGLFFYCLYQVMFPTPNNESVD
ncbi:MAG TPA: hypothetical protein ENI68_07185 [Gammaproteobacteria bacterium]|nr:hypothetical protein [Gammaproteobacteria bacterium]